MAKMTRCEYLAARIVLWANDIKGGKPSSVFSPGAQPDPDAVMIVCEFRKWSDYVETILGAPETLFEEAVACWEYRDKKEEKEDEQGREG